MSTTVPKPYITGTSGQRAECTRNFSLDIGEIEFRSAPSSVKEGTTIGTPSINSNNPQVDAINERWLNAQMQNQGYGGPIVKWHSDF